MTIGPVLTWSNAAIQEHLDNVLAIPGAKLAFGGKPLDPATHSIPDCYGSWEPTAVTVPLEALLADQADFDTATKELFGPFQVYAVCRVSRVSVLVVHSGSVH